METKEKTSQVIKDLIVINNDRYEGYKTAAEETKDSDLKVLFTGFSNQSRGFGEELRKFVPADEKPERDETKNTGKLYRAWMDFKAAITSKDRKNILASCEFGEDVAKQHYEEALEHTEDIPSEALSIVQHQFSEIKKGHDKIKAMRDGHL